jgi:hypothetical protein
MNKLFIQIAAATVLAAGGLALYIAGMALVYTVT